MVRTVPFRWGQTQPTNDTHFDTRSTCNTQADRTTHNADRVDVQTYVPLIESSLQIQVIVTRCFFL